MAHEGSAYRLTGYDHEGKKQTQGGVESIFTTDHRGHGNAVPAIGLLAVGGGVSIWAWAIRNLNTSYGGNISQGVVSSALTFASLGMLTMLVGACLCVYSFAVRRTRLARNTIGFPPLSNSRDLGLTNELSDSETLTRQYRDSTWSLRSTRRVSKTFVVAVAQSLVYVALYAGVVTEYNNNPRMQAWVQINLPLVGDLLNYYGVVLLSGLLAVLALQFLPRNRSSR